MNTIYNIKYTKFRNNTFFHIIKSNYNTSSYFQSLSLNLSVNNRTTLLSCCSPVYHMSKRFTGNKVRPITKITSNAGKNLPAGQTGMFSCSLSHTNTKSTLQNNKSNFMFNKNNSNSVSNKNVNSYNCFPNSKHNDYLTKPYVSLKQRYNITEKRILCEISNKPVSFNISIQTSSEIPIAPPIPSTIHKHIQPTSPITVKVLKETKESLKPLPVRCLTRIQIDQRSNKDPYPFRSLSTTVPYTPVISLETKSSNFTKEQVINFCLERGLIIKDVGTQFPIKVMIKPEGHYMLGVKKNSYKLTQFGNAYYQKISNHKNINTNLLIEYPPNIINPEIDGDIIIVKPKGLPNISQTGNVTHLLHAYPSGDYYYISGSYTSKKVKINLSKTQNYDYELQKQSKKNLTELQPASKPQNFIEKLQLQKIHKSEVLVTKWGKEYLDFIKQQEFFLDLFHIQKEKPCVPFNSTGVTTQDAHTMCLDFDYNCAKAQKHPTTLNQEIYHENHKKLNNSTTQEPI